MTSTLSPAQLRCEYLTNPLGIDVLRPRLYWVLESEERSQRQTAYQILVGTTEDHLAADNGDLWDSGKVASSQSVQIIYGGPPLRSRERCWWKVRVWDGDDKASDYSSASWWEMGLLTTLDWKHAAWIGLPCFADDGLQPSPYLRTAFTTDRPIRRARIYASAKGLYQLHLNGARLSDNLFPPGWTDYEARIQYQVYDVTQLIKHGENALGAILGRGWYSGYIGWHGQAAHYGTDPQLLVQLEIEDVAGNTFKIVSGRDWKAATGPILYSDFLMGEVYDARQELTGWDTPGFDDSSWQLAEVLGRRATHMVGERMQPIKKTGQLSPQRITEPEPGTYVYDMGQNMVGWVTMRVEGPAGTRVRLRFAEVLTPEGMLYTEALRGAKQTDTYILSGNGEEIFEPHFTYHGFRYVEVTGYPGQPTLDALTGYVINSALPETGIFECSHPLVNQLQRNIIWTQRGNFVGLPTDCPQRDERMGWMADAQVFMRTACYNMDVAAFFSKWMFDIVDAQSPAGAFSDVTPRIVDIQDGSPGWGEAGVIIPWTLYISYGDKRIIEQNWDAMVRWMDYVHETNPRMLRTERLNYSLNDWLSIKADTPKEVLATAYWAYSATLMAEMAEAIGKEDEAEQYKQLFDDIKSAFIETYVLPDGRVYGETQTVHVLALFMDLLPADLRAAAANHVVADITARGGHLSTGLHGVPYVFQALSANGYGEVAYQLLLEEASPSWGYSILHGATTLWERWDSWTSEQGFQNIVMNSFNHCWLGSIGQWLYHSVSGINTDPRHPGYEHILIRPQPGPGLTWARGEYNSIRGKIKSGWQIDGDLFKLSVTIPPNTTATVELPSADPSRVLEGGCPLNNASGVTFSHAEGGTAVFEIQSGDYAFTSPLL
jgi:alpha-L-rhamnosidase